MASKNNHLVEFLQTLSFFAGLPEEDIAMLIQQAQIRDFKKHQNIFRQGDKVDRFFVIINGWVKLYRHTAEGEESIVSIFTRGDILGETAIIAGAVYPFSADTAEETKFLEIPAGNLRERAMQDHKITARLMSAMARELRNVQMENEHLSIMSAPQRVGCFLLQLSANMVGNGGTFSFPYDKSLAAARLGMKAETFSRALAQLKPLGVTVKGPEVTIESFAHLIGYVCNHCSSQDGECRNAGRATCSNEQCAARLNS